MYMRADGRLLKTKIVATMGKPRKGVHDPQGHAIEESQDPDRFWDTFLGWFSREGMYLIDVIRLNLSFYDPPGENERRIIKWLRDNREKVKNVALLGDLPGPKLRLRGIPSGNLQLSETSELTLHLRGRTEAHMPSICVGGYPLGEIDKAVVSKMQSHLSQAGRPLTVILGDGPVVLEVRGITDGALQCVVTSAGAVQDRCGVTLGGIPLSQLNLPSFHDADKCALDFLISQGYDWKENFADPHSLGSLLTFVGVSFVKTKHDIIQVKRYAYERILEILKQSGSRLTEPELGKEALFFVPAIIAKIETPQAWENIDEILDVADGVMVARGDLAEQIGPEQVPAVQKELIRLCNLRGKPVITATEMLAGMENSPHPTRAEANDVFNAILDGSDAVMLSGETSKGVYPVQAVEMMVRIAEAAETQFENFGKRRPLEESERGRLNEQRFERLLVGANELHTETRARLQRGLEQAITSNDQWLADLYLNKLRRNYRQEITDRISSSACMLASSERRCEAILAPTMSGRTVRMISRFRPTVKVIGVAHDAISRRKMVISYGVYPINCGRVFLPTGAEFKSLDEVFCGACTEAKKEGCVNKGDIVIYVAGTPLFVPGNTNLIQIKEIEEPGIDAGPQEDTEAKGQCA